VEHALHIGEQSGARLQQLAAPRDLAASPRGTRRPRDPTDLVGVEEGPLPEKVHEVLQAVLESRPRLPTFSLKTSDRSFPRESISPRRGASRAAAVYRHGRACRAELDPAEDEGERLVVPLRGAKQRATRVGGDEPRSKWLVQEVQNGDRVGDPDPVDFEERRSPVSGLRRA
jgi:hypothetical protein